MNAIKKENGRIKAQGAGGFLNPPTHPEHRFSVETDLRRRPENRGSMSLSYAVDCDYLAGDIRHSARRILADWQRPALESDEIQDWIHTVLGYFKNCYKGTGPEPECWNVSNLRMARTDNIADLSVDDHAGVHLIRKYYPEFVPLEKHFSSAYWGTKPE